MRPIYDQLNFPPAPKERPYVFINMVSTIDGKITSGGRDEPVSDIGSALDHALMKKIEQSAQGILVGAGTLRANPIMVYPPQSYRFVATRTGGFDRSHRFFADAPERAVILCPAACDEESDPRATVWHSDTSEIDLLATLARMRNELGIERLLCEGGSVLNSQLFTLGLIDEIFLTLAPKIRLGEDTPTIADGLALARDKIQEFKLIECHQVKNELFLRYRRALDLT